jgi:hypothetical protein
MPVIIPAKDYERWLKLRLRTSSGILSAALSRNTMDRFGRPEQAFDDHRG